jgi:hypothetical protein
MAQQPSSTNSEALCEGQARFREDSPPSSRAVLELSSIAPRAASGIADFASPRMAPGIGGFNIDPPPSRASPLEGNLAIDMRRVDAEPFASRHPAAPGISDVATPRMVPGVRDFNIDSPTPGAFPVEDDVAILRMRRRSLLKPKPKPKLIPLPPIQVERKAVIVGKNESSFVFYLLAIIAVVAIMLLAFPDVARIQVRDILGQVAPLDEALSSAGTSVYPARLIVESQKGLANEPLPLGISLKDASGEETVTVAGLAEGTELSLGTSIGLAGWLLSAHDLDKTFVGARGDFVGVMDATVNLRSASGQLLDSRIVRFEWIKKKEESLLPARISQTDTSAPVTGSRRDSAP